MKLRFYLIYVLATLIRFFPFPTRTGIRKLGNPDATSPVLVTGNYILTVELLKKELEGLDLYLLVTNSRGINIWCAATGGHFTNHDIISILKTSGIDKLVDHRDYILPQLAATGIEPRVIHKKTGWKGNFGPVRAKDIKTFLATPEKISRVDRTVDFPVKDRIDMAIAWGFIMTLFVFAGFVFFSMSAALFSVVLCWYISFLMFLTFPFFASWFETSKSGTTNSMQTKLVYPSIFGILTIPIYLALQQIFQLQSPYIYIEPFIVVVILLSLTSDLKGSTPVFKSDLIEERIFQIKLHEDLCRGAGDCVTVCPKNCFVLNEEEKKVSIPRPEDCVQCGACIVQCPFDALYLQNKSGEVLEADILRVFRLNLMGKRAKSVEN